MAKSYTYGHTVYLEKLEQQNIPDEFVNNIKQRFDKVESIWNVFNATSYISYFVVWDGDFAYCTEANEYQYSKNELDAIRKIALKLFPESNVITDQDEIRKYKTEELRKNSSLTTKG